MVWLPQPHRCPPVWLLHFSTVFLLDNKLYCTQTAPDSCKKKNCEIHFFSEGFFAQNSFFIFTVFAGAQYACFEFNKED
jgi:hypothetical protein